ncbi:MAG: hypothetical protein J0M04_21695 [Verrucomicrobia bacterium]|nr:hypothetical protein [Verrucomicrobiota bacterium]
MKRHNPAPVSRPTGTLGASVFRPNIRAGLALLACVIPASVLADPVNLIRNGDFSAGMSHWVKPAEFGVADPVQNGALLIYKPVTTFTGPVVSQSIHATGIANVPVTVSARLKRLSTPVGSSVRICLEFVRAGGAHETVPVIQPQNSELETPGVFFQLSSSFTFPADATKLIRATVEITGGGFVNFEADDLAVTGEVTPGPVPEITSVSPASVAYDQPVTVGGIHLGTSPGTLTINGSSADLTVDSWSDSQVVFRLAHPHQGGKLVLTSQDVSANQIPEIRISSARYQLSNPTPSVIAIPGQTVEIGVRLAFFNGYTTATGIQLALQGAGGTAAFAPNPVSHQGGSRLTFNTAGLSPGVHSYTIIPTDQGEPGNQAPFSVDLRVPETLDFFVVDSVLGNIPVTGTLSIESHSPVRTDYTLSDNNSADITSASPLDWTSSNPAVLLVLPPPNTAVGPSLIPLATGTCTLTATAPNGFSRSIPVSVDLETAHSGIEQIGFTFPQMDNSGEGDYNLFTAVAADGESINSIDLIGFEAVNFSYQFGSTGSMEFQTPAGLAPGFYEFSAKTESGSTRSALLEVTNASGTGMLSGSVSQPYLALKAGVLEFYDAATNALVFTRDIATYGDFQLGAIPPGSYRIRFVPDQESVPVPLDSPWFANGTSIENAQTVTVAADQTTSGVHFFVFEAQQTHAEIVIPQLIDPVRNGNTFSFGFDSLPGLRYTAEYSETLDSEDWHPFAIILGDGNPKTVTDTNAPGTSRFYRLSVSAE